MNAVYRNTVVDAETEIRALQFIAKQMQWSMNEVKRGFVVTSHAHALNWSQ